MECYRAYLYGDRSGVYCGGLQRWYFNCVHVQNPERFHQVVHTHFQLHSEALGQGNEFQFLIDKEL